MDISFNNISAFRKDLIKELLLQAYQDIPTITEKEKKEFEQFSDEVNAHPQWVGRFVFITAVDDTPVGFVSFDPQQKPLALIGHNALLPELRGKGLGKQQMMHAVDEIKRQGFKKITVSTCSNQYFIPAQKMYESCGFREIGKFYKEGSDVEMIGYELNFVVQSSP